MRGGGEWFDRFHHLKEVVWKGPRQNRSRGCEVHVPCLNIVLCTNRIIVGFARFILCFGSLKLFDLRRSDWEGMGNFIPGGIKKAFPPIPSPYHLISD